MRSKKAIYNISSNLLLQLVTLIYGFVVPKIIISNFGSSINGLISSITQFLAYITLLESGFGPVVKALLYKPIAKNDKNEIANIIKSSEKFFRLISKIFIIYILVLMIIYPVLINNEFKFLFSSSLILIISISTFAQYYFGMTYKLYLQANQESYIVSIIQTVTYIFSIIVIVVCAKLSFSIHTIKLISGLIFVLRPLLQNYYVKKKYKIDFLNVNEKYKIKNKWDGLAQHVASVIHGNTDITILTIFRSLSEVSVYSVYSLVVKGIKSIIQAFTGGFEALFGDMLAKKENDKLKMIFGIYETIYLMLITVLFTCTMFLITPFISLYTRGITDTNYCRPIFGILIVISEFICMIRLPYIDLTYAAGHFKETRKGAWVECLSNLFLSIILVFKFGLVGITIGTIVAMTIRTIEFIYHSNKYILNSSIIYSFKKIVLMVFEQIIIIYILNYFISFNSIGVAGWIAYALISFIISLSVVIFLTIIFYYKDIIYVFNMLKKILKRKKCLK